LVIKAAGDDETGIENTDISDYTLSGKLVRVSHGSTNSISTISVVLQVDETFFILTTSHSLMDNDPVNISTSSEDEEDKEFSPDTGSNEALVVDSWKWSSTANENDNDHASTAEGTASAHDSTHPISPSVNVGSPVASGSDWALYSIPQHLYRPNTLLIANERRFITSPTSKYLSCNVIINTGKSGMVKGRLLQGFDYIRLEHMDKSLTCLSIKLNTGSGKCIFGRCLL
jgi:hypothetical protein